MYVAHSMRLTHRGAKKIVATAVDMAKTDLRIPKAAVESIGVSWKS